MRERIIAVVLFLVVANQLPAVITVKTPLSNIQESALYICVGKVEKYLPEKPAMMVSVTEDIKGKAPFRKMPINCKIDDEKLFKSNQIEPLLKRFGPEIEIVFFISDRSKQGKNFVPIFAFTNGTWFLLRGERVDDDNVVFALQSAEPYFRKSYRGTTEELVKLLKDHAAGKAKLPPLDDKVMPGFGPEYVAPKKASSAVPPLSPRVHHERLIPNENHGGRGAGGFARPDVAHPPLTPDPSPPADTFVTQTTFNRAGGEGRGARWLFAPIVTPISGGPLFGVIPTLGVGAPLAILALLFPTVFGGVFVLFRQWLAFITAISLSSTLLLLHLWLKQSYLRGTWWGDDPALWLMMTIATALCVVWAWRRQLTSLAAGDAEASRRTELLILLFMCICCLGTTIVTWRFFGPVRWSDSGWTLTIVMSIGILAGTLHRAWTYFRSESLFGAPPMPTEGVILGAFLLGHLVFVPAIFGSNVNTEGKVETGEGGAKIKIGGVVKKWDFASEPKGMYASSPLVDGDYIYAAYSETGTQFAALVKLDRHVGLKKWEFLGKNDDLRQMISTPCIADGKLYFGEGFHDDKNCRVFCVDAEKGTEIWTFKTGGQTESSPCVANGKLYIGAGNEGIYCLDAKTGEKIWRFPDDPGPRTRVAYQDRILRFGGGMLVVGDKLYCATGVDRNQPKDKGETALFCFDAATGKQIWKAAAPYPVWSKPIVRDGIAYITTGNGDVGSDAQAPEVPGGALLCLDAETGKEKWRFKTSNGIIEAPAVDEGRIYVGARDGNLYCVGRADGKERWRHFLGSPIIATPVIDVDPNQRTISLFAMSDAGKVCCLDPQTGDISWTYDLSKQKAYISASPALVVTRTKNEARRQLYFGAGIGGGTLELALNRPVFYCLEDTVKVE